MDGNNSTVVVAESIQSCISKIARRDLNAERAFLVYGGEKRFPIQRGVEAISRHEMAALVRDP